LQLIKQTGGKVTESEVLIAVQRPKAPKLEQWSPGVPEARLKASSDPAFSFSGSWGADKDARLSSQGGNEVTLTFQGVAVAIMGNLGQYGGRAEVFLDGKKVGIADSYIVERTNDKVLWNTYGLKPGKHTVRLVTSNDADPRSKGKRLSIQEAVIYRAAK